MSSTSIKNYGIYLAYHQGTELRAQGLGRYLASLLGGASSIKDVRWVILCPYEIQKTLLELCDSEGINTAHFDLVSPSDRPFFVARRFYKKFSINIHTFFFKMKEGFLHKAEERKDRFSGNWIYLIFSFIRMAILSGVLILIRILSSLLKFIFRPINKVFRWINSKFQIVRNRFSAFKSLVNESAWKLACQDLVEKANKMLYIKVWYCPTPFWPEFNHINRTKVLCVPDIVITEFPIKFSIESSDMGERLKKIQKSIYDGKFFITYSEYIKKTVLIDQYCINPSNVFVIPHARSNLREQIQFCSGNEAYQVEYCKKLFLSSMKKSCFNKNYTDFFENAEVKFLFYPTQFRPSKNIMTLLRAYKDILKNKNFGIKLILTGYPFNSPEILNFVTQNSLEYDVLFLHNLTVQELAAFYKLAQLVVCTTLSEGGFPFHCVEAMSAGTPAIAAAVPIVMEFVKEDALREMMTFDAFDWRDLSEHIEWALNNREVLIKAQQDFYHKIDLRTWERVVKEHFDIFEKISV